MKQSLQEIKKVEKINETKLKRSLLLYEICYNIDMAEITSSKLSQQLKINYRTAKKLKGYYQMKEILQKVKIDRALRELLFSCPEQVECFYFLIKDLNYFYRFDDVQKEIKISRYNYRKVKEYIQEELKRITDS